MMLQKTGYETDDFFSNVALGVSDGLDGALWSYVYATIIFSGALSVFIPVGLTIILFGWAIVSIFITLTSRLKVHVVAIDEQSVVIFGAIGMLLVTQMGPRATTNEGLATLLAIMALTSILIAVVLLLVARNSLSRLLELLPFPVICGYMAGIAWLLLDAGVYISVDAPISLDLLDVLERENNFLKLVIALIGGAALIAFTRHFEQAWALPLASLIIVIGFYSVALSNDMSKSDLVAGAWMYDIQSQDGDMLRTLSNLSIADIDISFVISVIPQILTIIFLTVLSASMSLSIIAALNPKAQIDTTDELQGLGYGNIFLGAIACPPGYSDAVTSALYAGFGASSRWMAIASSATCLVIMFVGVTLISYLPNILICSSIFLFAFQMFYEWMYENVRSFTLLDYSIICAILITVIGFGFVEGILLGVFLAVFLFVLRYSRISAVQSVSSIESQRSSVERSPSGTGLLNRFGSESIIYTLRGFLFFGTANIVRDTIREAISSSQCKAILLDLQRVSGIDISALNTLKQLRETCDVEGILIIYSGAAEEIREKLANFDVASNHAGDQLIFAETDFALEYIENMVLAEHQEGTVSCSVQDHLSDILDSEEGVNHLVKIMERSELDTNEVLFLQGDSDRRFFILESGNLSARIETADGRSIRIKKFSPGSIIGEMSNYTSEKSRTASVVADEPAVLYCIDPSKLNELPEDTRTECLATIHELVARTLTTRIDFMNKRLMLELT